MANKIGRNLGAMDWWMDGITMLACTLRVFIMKAKLAREDLRAVHLLHPPIYLPTLQPDLLPRHFLGHAH